MRYRPPAPIALVLDADPDTLELLREWLLDAGWRVVDPTQRLMTKEEDGPVQLVLVDLAYPRHAASQALQRVAHEHAGVPVLALSATFHASVDPHGELAQALGVGAVLAKPIRRDALLSAVHRLSPATLPEPPS